MSWSSSFSSSSSSSSPPSPTISESLIPRPRLSSTSKTLFRGKEDVNVCHGIISFYSSSSCSYSSFYSSSSSPSPSPVIFDTLIPRPWSSSISETLFRGKEDVDICHSIISPFCCDPPPSPLPAAPPHHCHRHHQRFPICESQDQDYHQPQEPRSEVKRTELFAMVYCHSTHHLFVVILLLLLLLLLFLILITIDSYNQYVNPKAEIIINIRDPI